MVLLQAVCIRIDRLQTAAILDHSLAQHEQGVPPLAETR